MSNIYLLQQAFAVQTEKEHAMKYSRSQWEYRTLFREFHKDHGITYEFHIIEVELISKNDKTCSSFFEFLNTTLAADNSNEYFK